MASQIIADGTKQKRVRRSLDFKHEVYKRLKACATTATLRNEHGISKATISEIKHFSGPKIEQFLNENPNLYKRKNMKIGTHPELEKALLIFFNQQRSLKKPISGCLLKEKAIIMQEIAFRDDNFSSGTIVPPSSCLTDGFLNRFKQRHGIRKLKCVGEKASSNESAVDPFIDKFRSMVLEESLSREQIYNADETGLCWRAVPTTTLAGPDEKKADGLKIDKDRVTLMACSNSSGTHKLDLVFIYKYQNPRALKHMDKRKLPVNYYSQQKAWMTLNIFHSWFTDEFIPKVRQHLKDIGLEQKAVLVLDNAPSHTKFYKDSPVGKDYKMWCVFLPANTTALIQPMDQAVLDTEAVL